MTPYPYVIFSFGAGDYIRKDGQIHEFRTHGDASRYLLGNCRRETKFSREKVYDAPFRIHKAVIRRIFYEQ